MKEKGLVIIRRSHCLKELLKKIEARKVGFGYDKAFFKKKETRGLITGAQSRARR